MTTPLFSINAAAEVLERDRRTLVKALRRVPPDGRERGTDRWRLRSIIDALADMQPAPAPAPTGEIDRRLQQQYDMFDQADTSMRRLSTLDARRQAAIGMGPLISTMDALQRQVSLDNGVDQELTDLRCDKLFLLYLRGFEAPCSWSMSQVWDAVDVRE
jgi:hypothetical protein